MEVAKKIFLFGHRKQHGKDSCCNIIEKILNNNNINNHRTYFAKKLKQTVAEKYNLDFSKMDLDSYKNYIPPWQEGKSRTVRDILIHEGNTSRDVWKNVWACPAYLEILNSGAQYGIISDFRFPNEFDCFSEIFSSWNDRNNISIDKPEVVKILVHKPNGRFENDGADGELPDVDKYWDYVIMNDDLTHNWKLHLEDQIRNLLKTLGVDIHV